MTYLDDPKAGMTTVHVPRDGVLVLQLDNIKDFIRLCPEQYAALIECSAFVNWRRMKIGDSPVIVLSFAT